MVEGVGEPVGMGRPGSPPGTVEMGKGQSGHRDSARVEELVVGDTIQGESDPVLVGIVPRLGS